MNSKLQKWVLAKNQVFFIFCLYINEKWKKLDFLVCPSSLLIKNHWKKMIFGFLWLQKIQKSWFSTGFYVKFVFWNFVPAHFCWKTNEKTNILDFRNLKNYKNIDFSMIFCKKWKFWRVSILMVRKKFFPAWFRWSKNVV